IAAARLVEIVRALLGRLHGQRRPEEGFGLGVRFGHRPVPETGALFKKRTRCPARLTVPAEIFTGRPGGSGGSTRSTARSWRNAGSGQRLPANPPEGPRLPRPTGPRSTGA